MSGENEVGVSGSEASPGASALTPFGEALELLEVAIRNLTVQWCKDGDCLDCRIRRFLNAHQAEGPVKPETSSEESK